MESTRENALIPCPPLPLRALSCLRGDPICDLRRTSASSSTLTVRDNIRGFYAVLDRDDEQLARTLVGPGGARVLQVRIKHAGAAELLRVAEMARRVCDDAGAMLVVNDRIDVASRCRTLSRFGAAMRQCTGAPGC